MLKHTTHIITFLIILIVVGCKEDSVSPPVDLEAPVAPVLTSPLNNDSFTSEDKTILLIWTAIEDAASYQVQVSNDTTFSNTDIDQELSASQYLMNNNIGDGIYYWRISSIDSDRNIGEWSEVNTFLVGYINDIDDNIYKIVKIGEQWWMAENLAVTHYRNGDAIPNVTGNSTWASMSTDAYCVYENDEKYANTYGYLYNWVL